MALAVQVRYINNGDPLNEDTLRASILDIVSNLEDLFAFTETIDFGTDESAANRVVRRDLTGTAKFATPTNGEHPWRLTDHQTFRNFILDGADYVRDARLRSASSSQRGVVTLTNDYQNPPAGSAISGDALTQFKTYIEDQVSQIEAFPVGSIFISASPANPGTTLGYGTWQQYAQGRTLIGQSGGDPIFGSAGATGGQRDAVLVQHEHNATTTPAGGHGHDLGGADTSGSTGTDPGVAGFAAIQTQKPDAISEEPDHTHPIDVEQVGEDGTDKNLPPYVVVYFWRRVS